MEAGTTRGENEGKRPRQQRRGGARIPRMLWSRHDSRKYDTSVGSNAAVVGCVGRGAKKVNSAACSIAAVA